MSEAKIIEEAGMPGILLFQLIWLEEELILN